MSERGQVATDWDTLAGKAAKYAAVFLGVVAALLSVPAVAEKPSLRMAISAGLAAAAVIAWVSGGSLTRRGDPTEGAARRICAALFMVTAVWFTNLLPTPQLLRAPVLAVEVNEILRDAGVVSTPAGLDRALTFTLFHGEADAARLQQTLMQALEDEVRSRPLGNAFRETVAGVRLNARQGSLASGQVTATARVALAANDANRCDFAVSTLRPMPSAAAAEFLAERIVDRAQAYVEGNDTC